MCEQFHDHGHGPVGPVGVFQAIIWKREMPFESSSFLIRPNVFVGRIVRHRRNFGKTSFFCHHEGPPLKLNTWVT